MLVNKRTSFGGVTLEAGVVLAKKGQSAAVKALSHARVSTFHGIALVRFVTIRAAHFSF